MKTYHDIVGDGGSDVLGQVQAQQQAITAALAGVRRIVAIASGKGGVGKSTLAQAFARALHAEGRRIALLDADVNGPCQARMAGLGQAPWIPGENGLALPRTRNGIGLLSFGSVLAADRPLEMDSVSVGEEHVWRATREVATLRQLLATVDWGELDVLVFDLPPGTERTLQLASILGGLGPPVGFVLVTLPSEVSRSVVARSVTALRASSVSVLGYIENMSGYYCRDCGAVRPLFPAAREGLDLPCLATVPFDPGLAELCDQGWDEVAPDGFPAGSPAFDAIRDAARQVLESPQLDETPSEPPS